MTMLSKCKREVESKLQMVKKCLQEMGQVRRLLHGRLSSSSQNLQLDAQRYMVVHVLHWMLRHSLTCITGL